MPVWFGISLVNMYSDIYKKAAVYVLFYTNDLRNTKTKNKLNKHAKDPFLIFADQIGETEKVKQKRMYTYINW